MKFISPVCVLCILAPLVLVDLPIVAAEPSDPGTEWVYVGTYTGAKSKGIYVSRFNPINGRFSPVELAAETRNPSFLAVHPNRPVLYAVNEVDDFGGKPTGMVSAFSIDPKTGKLKLLNQQASGGSGPCHLSVDRSGRSVLVANYGGGSIAALPILADGGLGEAISTIQHQGSSVNQQRQAGPHAHFITTDPANRYALACDLGLDQVRVYRFDREHGSLAVNTPPFGSARPGAGPRHLVFAPSGRFVYVINELDSTLAVMGYDSQGGTLNAVQTISTLPENFGGQNSCAEVQMHPSGKFLYASNRGHDSIAAFSVDKDSGHLSLIEHYSTKGNTPRHFALDPSGNWLLAENQGSDNVVVFRVDTNSGRLRPLAQKLEVASPVCVQFVPAE